MTQMNSPREDQLRISFGSAQDWQRLKGNYHRSAIALLDENVAANGISSERDLLIAHLNRVRK